jgi:small GTP-binding protein
MGTWFSKEPHKVIILGLDAAGKTTLLTRVTGEAEDKNPLPTIGFNLKTFSKRGLTLTMWDVGGQERTRNLWGNYVLRCDMLVYVVDLQDPDRLTLTFQKLENILHKYPVTFSKAPVVVFGNKTDVGISTEVIEKFRSECARVANNHWSLNLRNERKNPFIYIEGSAKNGERIGDLTDAIIFELEEIHTSYLWRTFRYYFLV